MFFYTAIVPVCTQNQLCMWSYALYYSYSMIVLYSRDHKGLGVAHEKNITQKLALIFPHDD